VAEIKLQVGILHCRHGCAFTPFPPGCSTSNHEANVSLQNSPRELGKKQSLLVKIGLGFLLLSGLVLLIWGPLVFVSFIGSTSPPNPPTEVTIRLTLAGFEVGVVLITLNYCLCYIHSDNARMYVSMPLLVYFVGLFLFISRWSSSRLRTCLSPLLMNSSMSTS